MKAAAVTQLNKIEILDLPMPTIGEYEVLCEMRYGATCTGTDTHILVGCPWGIRYPIICGHESVGRVVEMGSKVRNFKVGDLVTRVGAPAYPELGISNGNGWGGYAQYGVGVDHWAVTADGMEHRYPHLSRRHLIVPHAIDERTAPLFITLRETLSYIKRAGFTHGSGDSLLILGSGGNGLAFALHAKRMGAGKVCMIGNPNKAEKAAKSGVDDFFDYRDAEFAHKIRDKYIGGFDFLIDAVGESTQLEQAMRCVRNGGTIGIYGENEYGQGKVRLQASGGSYRFYNNGYREEETHQTICDYYLNGWLDPSIFVDVDDIRPLDELAAVFEDIKAKRLKDAKALIKLHI